MINPATQQKDQLNDFTCAVKELGQDNWAGFCWVQLRNGTLVRPVFIPAEDETCVDCFGSRNNRWHLDGTSVTNHELDMMGIIVDTG